MAVAFSRTYGGLNDAASAIASGSALQVLYRIIDITTIAVGTNTCDIGYLPKGAIVVGGCFTAADLDTGTEALDMDLGITANGVDSADPDFFMNGGIFTGDAADDVDTTGAFTNYANRRDFGGPFPVTQLGAKTLVQLITNVAANATGTGKCVIRIDYITPGASTS